MLATRISLNNGGETGNKCEIPAGLAITVMYLASDYDTFLVPGVYPGLRESWGWCRVRGTRV